MRFGASIFFTDYSITPTELAQALEARGFGRPGRRTLLWWPADSRAQAVVRWALVLALVGLIVARLAGWLP